MPDPNLFAQESAGIATPDELKLELRLSGDQGEHDAMLARHISAAVSLVEEMTTLPLLDSWNWRDVPEGGYPTDRTCMPYRGARPLVFEGAFLRKITHLQYLPDTGDPFDEATEVELTEARVRIHISNGLVSKINGEPVITRLSAYAKDGFEWPSHQWDIRPRVRAGYGTGTTAILKQAVLSAAKCFYQDDPEGAQQMIEFLLSSSNYVGE